MADSMYESKWIDFSPEWRKYFILAIRNAQRRVLYHGFHVIELHLETFVQVRKFVYNFKIKKINDIQITDSKISVELLHDVQDTNG